MPDQPRRSPVPGLILLALSVIQAWPLHASTRVIRLVIIVFAAFAAGMRLGPWLPERLR